MHYIIAFSFNNTIIIVSVLVLCLKTLKSYYILSYTVHVSTVNSRFKKDLNLQIHLQKTIFLSNDRFLESVHKQFLNQTT